MISVKIKIENDKLEEFLAHIQTLDSIKSIDYKLPPPKPPKKEKVIYKPYTFDNLVALTDLTIQDNGIFHNDTKLNTIQLIANYQTVIKMVERMGLNVNKIFKHDPVIPLTKDMATRYKVVSFKIKHEEVKPINMLMTRNIPLLFDYATKQKKAKGSYCLLTFTGLEKIKEGEEFSKILSFIKRKTFNLYFIK